MHNCILPMPTLLTHTLTYAHRFMVFLRPVLVSARPTDYSAPLMAAFHFPLPDHALPPLHLV